ncbi:hypothetical protein KKA33_03650 [Patescibacteria group bacterium]|nr:hypothetical protein [Patescibacteria group bacterium]
MTECTEAVFGNQITGKSPNIFEITVRPEEMRLDFVRRCRAYLNDNVINPRGPLSNEALRYIAEQRGFDLLAHAHCYQDRSCYDELLEAAARSSVVATPWKTLEHAPLFDGYAWEEDVLLKAARQCRGSQTLHELAPRIKNKGIREKVLAIADRLDNKAKK